MFTVYTFDFSLHMNASDMIHAGQDDKVLGKKISQDQFTLAFHLNILC